MASYNKVLLMGNLTREPELRYTPGGQAVCDIGIAVNRKYTASGQDKEEVCFVDIVVWAKQAESCGKYLQKGSSVFVEGRLQYDAWEDKEGKKRSKLRVTAERVQFLGSKNNESRQTDRTYNSDNGYAQKKYQKPTNPVNNYNGHTNETKNVNYNSSQQFKQNMPINNNEPMAPPPPKFFDNDEPEDDIPF